MELQDRIAVVTGASSGIGAATAAALTAAGAVVVRWDRDGEPEVRCDISSEDDVVAAMAETVSRWGAPSAFVAAAGIGSNSRLLDLDMAVWDRTHAVNLRGTVVCLREAARAMVAAGIAGSVVAVSSMNSHVIDPGMGAYTASKAGLNGVVRVAARELGAEGIRVNAVCPGATATAMSAGLLEQPGAVEEIVARTPLGRVGTPELVAQAIVAVLGTDWVTGQVIDADGGAALVSARKERNPYGDRPTAD